MGERESKEDIARLFSVVSSDRTGVNRHKMKCRKFCLNRTGCRVSILEDIQNLTGHSPKKPALPDPAWISRGAFQPQLLCYFGISFQDKNSRSS